MIAPDDAEDEVVEGEAAIRMFFDSCAHRMGIVELAGEDDVEFVRVNDNAARFLGRAASEMQGLRLSEVAAPPLVALWRSKYEEAYATKGAVSFELQAMRMGPGRYLSSIVYLGHSATGEPRFGFVNTDITARREAEDRLAAILENAPGFIVTVDRDLKIVSFNGPNTGEGRLPPPGVSVLDVIRPEQVDAARAIYEQVLRTGEPQQLEVQSIVPDENGEIHCFSTAIGPLRSGGEIVGLTLMGTDITERKRLEAQITRQNEELSREVEERRRTEGLLLRKQEEILALSTPLIEVWEGVLALPIIGVVDGDRAAHIMDKLLHEIARSRIRVAILDLTGVEEVDTATVGHLFRIARATGLLGSRCVLSGISPRIAQTMISIGVDAEGLATFRSLKDALKHALSLTAASPATKF